MMNSSRPVEMISIENDDDDSIDDGWHWHEQVCMSAFKVRSESESETLATTSITSSTVSSPSLHPLSVPNDHEVVPGLDDLQLLNDDSISASSAVIAMAPASRKSLRTHNPIRAIVDPIMSHSIKCGKERGDGKDQISLALGDPTAYGNISPCPVIINAITDALTSPGMAAGYVNALGTTDARIAIHKYHYPTTTTTLQKREEDKEEEEEEEEDKEEDKEEVVVTTTPDDVIVANGASGSLEIALTALLDEDSVLLVPRPGFPLYQVIAESHGARVVHYDLLPEQGWQVDLDHIDRIISEEEAKTNNDTNNIKVVRGIVVNNPSNPTGAVYSEEHLSQIILLAQKWNVPIVSDEIYGDLTFGSNVFHPMANVAAKLGYSVPVITASGLGKQYLVPGWRLGWIIFQDSRHGSIQEVKKGAQRLAQVVLGASRLAQVAIPAVLNPSNESDIASIAQWKANLHSQVENQAALLCGLLDKCHGLEVIRPQGAMYAMVRIHVHLFDDDIHDDVSFMKLLLDEENIVVLPGQAFGLDKEDHDTTPVFRVVFCAPEDVLVCACERISRFCGRHAL